MADLTIHDVTDIRSTHIFDHENGIVSIDIEFRSELSRGESEPECRDNIVLFAKTENGIRKLRSLYTLFKK